MIELTMKKLSIVVVVSAILVLCFGWFRVGANMHQGVYTLCQLAPPTDWAGDNVDLTAWEVGAWPIGARCTWTNHDLADAERVTILDDPVATGCVYGGLAALAAGLVALAIARRRGAAGEETIDTGTKSGTAA
jgi:hypothetical protein